MIRVCLLVVLVSIVSIRINAQPGSMLMAKVNGTGTIPLPQSANYRREVRNANNVDEEHIFRVCTGKNAKTCGFWENVKTKKKVPSGATNYNKNKKALVIKKMRATDFGNYMTGNKKTSNFIMQQTW
ncbi:unnamed protein product [Caenorhabditis brenneri]